MRSAPRERLAGWPAAVARQVKPGLLYSIRPEPSRAECLQRSLSSAMAGLRAAEPLTGRLSMGFQWTHGERV